MDDSNLRLSNREREEALKSLGSHFADGRLTVEEFDERAALAAQATTRGELAPLFADLPQPPASVEAKPVAPSPMQPVEEQELHELLRRKKRVDLVLSVLAAVTFLLFFLGLAVFQVPYFWIVFPIAGVFSAIVDQTMGLTKDEKRLIKELERHKAAELRQRLIKHPRKLEP